MAFIPVADTIEVELFQFLHGQKVENTLGFRLDGGFGAGEVIDLWNNLLIWWETTFSTDLSNNLSLRGAKITDLSSISAPAYEFNAPTPNPTGDDAVAALPGNVALCVSFRTLARGRSYRGRNYVCGLSENAVTGNTVDSTVVLALQAAYNGLRSLPFDNPWEHVVISRFNAGAPRTTGVATKVTSCVIVDPYVDSQRRRLTGRGQ